MGYYHTIKMLLDFLSTISWPIVALVVFLSLKTPIKNFINNIKKFTYGGTGIETNLANKQIEEDSLSEILGNNPDATNLDRILAKFSDSTLKSLDKIIENETQISTIDNPQNKYDRIYKYAKILILVKNIEKIHALIFGSQIRLLQRLNYSYSESKSDLKQYYDDAVKKNSEGYNDYSYENYLNFLVINDLVKIDNETVSITDYGKDFLRYIVEANLTVEKFN
ncbi:hypothetical protein [Flavobacterium sp. IB48]|uniref:hypothetical protein n=1 Tax=Flavobacterium sp. IB48 TaxID=2779375 RepID=UPI0018E70E19|nr:hypothetical protein [Flavobacterium sp. IB48]MBJ2124798.1 hypothetical protein [Flavobacterium sp. IB48]